jgi:hypothetical protein
MICARRGRLDPDAIELADLAGLGAARSSAGPAFLRNPESTWHNPAGRALAHRRHRRRAHHAQVNFQPATLDMFFAVHGLIPSV